MDYQIAQQYASNIINNNRCHPSSAESNNWLKKTSAVHRAIQGLANGTLDVDQINLKKYGILNQEETYEENKRKAKVRAELAEREVKERKRIKEEEVKRWWNDANILFSEKDDERNPENKSNKGEYTKEHIIERYSTNYTRWSESNYKPDDEATKEEAEQIEQEKENTRLTEFESNNKEWCDNMSNDIKERKDTNDRKQKDADKNRIKGNSYFQKKEYETALSHYLKAFEKFPFNVVILTNMAMCYGKLNKVEDAIEFCNRACFVDKRCVKSFYRRALLYVHKNFLDKALIDLELCKQLDSENTVVTDKLKWVLQEIKYEALEDHINRTVIDNNKASCDVTKGTYAEEPNMTNSNKATNLNKDALDTLQILSNVKDSELIDHCNIIDEIINKIKKYNDAKDTDNKTKLNVRDSFDLLSTILIEKLESHPITKTYLRISGHLETICSILKNKEREHALRKTLYDIISTSVIDEHRSMETVLKNKIIFTALSSLKFQEHNKNGINLILERISAAKIILTFLVNCKSISAHLVEQDFRKHKELLLSICSLITDICEDLIDDKESSIIICSNLLLSLCSKFEKHNFWKEFSLSQSLYEVNPVATISNALLYYKGNKKYKEIRSDIVEVIVSFSRIKEMRPFFNMPLHPQGHGKQSLCCIHILLSFAMSNKSEEQKSRNFALIALTNATVKGNGENIGNMKISLCQCRAIPLLFKLSTSVHSSISIKSNASELMGRCISIPQGMSEFIQYGTSVEKLFTAFSTVLDDNWFHSKICTENSKYNGIYIVNLIRIFASINQGKFDDIYYKALISLLPLPKCIAGKVTAKSICQAPQTPVEGSAYELASSDPSFFVNVSKALIIFLDSKKYDKSFLLHSKELVKRLICVLSNYSSMHPLFVKNSACILARLIKYDMEIKKYCKELRGIEIMMELGKKGTI